MVLKKLNLLGRSAASVSSLNVSVTVTNVPKQQETQFDFTLSNTGSDEVSVIDVDRVGLQNAFVFDFIVADVQLLVLVKEYRLRIFGPFIDKEDTAIFWAPQFNVFGSDLCIERNIGWASFELCRCFMSEKAPNARSCPAREITYPKVGI